MTTPATLTKVDARVRKSIAKLADPAQRYSFLTSLDDPAIQSNLKMLEELEAMVHQAMKDEPPSADSVFASETDAKDYLKQHVFPVISQNFRLFKTPKLERDEYIVINRNWLQGLDAFQSYGRDRDVNDRLLSIGLPASVEYWASEHSKTPSKLNVLSIWRHQPETQAGRLNTLEYLPGAPDIVNGHAFNTFKDVSVSAIEGIDVSLFLDHMRDNLCNGNAAYFEYLIKWLAHLVQRPAERPMTGISIIGGQGTGKGIFIDFIARMLGGRRNANTTTSAKDTKSFNTAVGSKLLVVFDEATFSGDHEQSDFMKKLVTEPFVRIEPKGIDAYEVQNFARCFITSNNMESSTPADIGARRWLIIECRNNIEQATLSALATAIGNNGEGKAGAIPHFVNGFKHHLECIDLTDFNPQALPDQSTGMQTKIHNHYKQDAVYAFLVDWIRAPDLTLHRYVREMVEGVAHEFDVPLSWEPEVRFADVYGVFEDLCKASRGKVVARNKFGGELAKFGLEAFSKAGNVRFIRLPSPMTVLERLRKSSRFDLLVDQAQETALYEAELTFKTSP